MSHAQSSIEVRVRAFATVRQALGADRLTLALPSGASVTHLLKRLAIDYPTIEPFLNHVVVTVNQQYVERGQTLASGDEVAVFPPVSGGSQETHVALTKMPIDTSAVIEMVAEPGAGAVVTFEGLVRDNNLGRKVNFLEYEAYPEMAEAKLRQVVNEARERWPEIRRVAVVHRLGHLELGETAVLVAIGASHRDDGAFQAVRYAIDRIKEIVPIWKKEGWADGEEWLEGDYRPRPGE